MSRRTRKPTASKYAAGPDAVRACVLLAAFTGYPALPPPQAESHIVIRRKIRYNLIYKT